MPQADARLALIHDWLTQELRLRIARIEPASADASFRRYFRVFRDGDSLIVMDAPPDKEDVRPYLKVTGLLESIGAHVPHIHQADTDRGLILLEDLGSTHYLSQLKNGADPDLLYGDALNVLADLQVVAWVINAFPGDFRDVNEAFNTVNIDEDTEVDNTGCDTFYGVSDLQA